MTVSVAQVCSACGQDLTLAAEVARLRGVVQERDRTIADQAKVNERLSAELKWHGLDDEALTITEAFELYRCVRQNDTAWTIYRPRIEPLVRRYGPIPCLQCGPDKWAEHVAARRKELCGRWGKAKPNDTTLNHELRYAKMMFQWLVDTGKLPRNPLRAAKKLRCKSRRESYLMAEDIAAMVEHGDCLRIGKKGKANDRRVLLFRAFVLAKFGGFMRLEEVLALRFDRIGPTGLVTIAAKEQKGAEARTICLPPFALDAIKALGPLDREPRIFVHRYRGKIRRVTGQAMRNWWHEVCRVSGVDARAIEGETIVPHLLRHSAASYADAQGAHVTAIQKALGHTSLGTTQIYLHADAERQALALATVMARLPPQSTKSSGHSHESVDSKIGP